MLHQLLNMNISWTLTIVVCLFYLQSCRAELKLVQAIFRHGNRMPTNGAEFYPNDPYVAKTFEPEGLGGLTNDGKMSSYKLGQYLRERYGLFLEPIYSKDIIWFRADEVERVVMTGQLVAAGLFPPIQEQRWNPHLNWQPVPVWAPPLSTDFLYNGLFCANFKKWRIAVEKSDKEVIIHEKENKEIYKYLSQHTGGNITQCRIFNLRQILYAQQDIGLKLPLWTKSVIPNGKLDELAVFDILIRTRTPELKQLLGGVWIREWMKNVDNHLNKNDRRKAFMYAAHELNIAPILVALNNFDNQIPSYSSTIMFELHEENNQHYVQVLYKNEDNICTLRIPGCEEKMCLLDTFRHFVEHVMPADPAELCGNVVESQSAIKQQTNY